jgi:hypothetical protein
MDRPHIRVIPEWFGGGTLPAGNSIRRLNSSPQARRGSSWSASPTIEEGLDKALAQAARVVKRTVEATTDQITSELQEALKS